MRTKLGRSGLLASTALFAAAAAFSGQAFAQTAPAAAGDTSAAPPATTSNAPVAAQPAGAQNTDTPSSVSEVVVTGSILRRKLSDTAAPITTVSAADLESRGITTVQEGIQDIAANGAAALPNSFTAQGAFAAGASTASLRGLTSNSTLTLVDGLRMTYYPLADDGTRNFVDLNTIPDVIVDRIETLKDGASAIYGADAIAGVVNVITKKTYEGLTVRAEGGVSQHGGGPENNFQVLVGHGNLNRDGYNVYLGLEYEHDSALYNHDRGYPYNTADLSPTCGTSVLDGSRTCQTNSVFGGLQFDNSFQGLTSRSGAIVPLFRAVDATGTPTGDYQLFSPTASCGPLRPVTITPGQAVAGGVVPGSGFDGNVNLCQQDLIRDYGVISPDDKRFSASFRATKTLGSNAQAYFAANYYQNDVYAGGTPTAIRNYSLPGPNGIAPYRTDGSPGITLPAYVCPQGSATFVCTAASPGATLNPNNPFAAQGLASQIYYRFGDIPTYTEQFSQTYRLAAGLNGTFNWHGDWHYDLEGTFSESNLRNTTAGGLFISGLLTAVNTGAYNFLNPSANTTAVRNLVSPNFDQYSDSKLGQLQASLQKDLFTLPGGPLQLGVSAAFRYEAINNPSGDDDANGALNRYLVLNPFGTVGDRTTEGVSFELDAPVLKQVDIGIAGRYDNYSTGVDNFSPQASIRVKPFADWAPQFDKITLRATYSQGFRIPSFAESNAFPTTGFTNTTPPASFQALHGNDAYVQQYSYGVTELSNPNLKPERSSNFTAGFVVEPIRQLSFSFDYYRISKRDVITPDQSHLDEAIAAYYAGQPIPAGYGVTADSPDPSAPGLQPRIFSVSYSFANLDQETSSGYDIGATARFNLPYGIKYTSQFDGNYVLRLNLVTPNGTQHYAGTLGPYIDVSASGTPKFRANWTHTLSYGPAAFSLTAYFTDGYQLYAEDEDGAGASCNTSGINTYYVDGATPVRCKVKPFWDFDGRFSYNVTSNLQAYVNVSNLFDKTAPLDPATYGGYQYNPAWANDGIYGRYFKVGLRATF